MSQKIREEAHRFCYQYIQNRVNSITEEIGKISESLLSEAKSTAGDKHETGRAMIQLEREKLGRQLAEAEKMQAVFNKIMASSKNERITLGSLVTTDLAMYYIAISAGRFEYSDATVFCISAGTPIGQLLLGKAKGDSISFNGKTSKILEID